MIQNKRTDKIPSVNKIAVEKTGEIEEELGIEIFPGVAHTVCTQPPLQSLAITDISRTHFFEQLSEIVHNAMSQIYDREFAEELVASRIPQIFEKMPELQYEIVDKCNIIVKKKNSAQETFIDISEELQDNLHYIIHDAEQNATNRIMQKHDPCVMSVGNQIHTCRSHPANPQISEEGYDIIYEELNEEILNHIYTYIFEILDEEELIRTQEDT